MCDAYMMMIVRGKPKLPKNAAENYVFIFLIFLLSKAEEEKFKYKDFRENRFQIRRITLR